MQARYTAVVVVCVLLAAVSAGMAAEGRTFTDEEIASAARAVIAERSKDGAFAYYDARAGEQLMLVPEDVRVVRGLKGYGTFPNIAFRDAAAPQKKYTLDFWLKPDGEKLRLMDMRVHKAPRADGSGWMTMTRTPLAWWWLPTIERASAAAAMPAWRVMGTIHAHVAVNEANGEVPLTVKASGALPALQFVDVEQPVGRSAADGRYFACVRLRKFGSEPGFYSTTYWVDGKTNQVTAGTAKPLRAGQAGSEKAAREPQCDVGGIAFDVVD